MMTHPIHLHGQYFEVVTGERDHKPRKHTINVKPGEKMAFDFTANAGDWAFHCHLLFHMHAGMMQVVAVMPGESEPLRDHLGRLKNPSQRSLVDRAKAGAAPGADPDAMDHGAMGHGTRPASTPSHGESRGGKAIDHDGHGGAQ
jgi:hypothetical protein